MPELAHRAKRTVASAVFLVMASPLLSGCLDSRSALELNEDQTVDGTIQIAVSNQFLRSLDIPADPESRLFRLFRQTALGTDLDLPEGVTAEPYTSTRTTGEVLTFEHVPFSDVEATLEALNATAAGDASTSGTAFDAASAWDLHRNTDDSIDVTGEVDLTRLPAAVGDAGITSRASFAITFPGEVTDTNGTVDGTTVTWALAPGEVTRIEGHSTPAVPPATDAASRYAVLVALLTGLALLLAWGSASTVAAVRHLRRASHGQHWLPAPVPLPVIGPVASQLFRSSTLAVAGVLRPLIASRRGLPERPSDADRDDRPSIDQALAEAEQDDPSPDDAATPSGSLTDTSNHVPVDLTSAPPALEDAAADLDVAPPHPEPQPTPDLSIALDLSELHLSTGQKLELATKSEVDTKQLYPQQDRSPTPVPRDVELVDPRAQHPSTPVLPSLNDLQVIQQIEPGWYQTADGSHLRWYDGKDWTEHVHPVAGSTPTEASAPLTSPY